MQKSLFTFILLAAATPLFAQSQQGVQEQRRSRTSGIDYITTNIGTFGVNLPESRVGFTYPRGAGGVDYLFGSGLWFGARKRLMTRFMIFPS